MDVAILPVFVAASLILNITPGPDFAFTLASAAKGGMRVGVLAAIGICAGIGVWVLLTAAGLAALIATYPMALDAIRVLGGAYLIFLAVQAVRSMAEAKPLGSKTPEGSPFLSGLITNCLNPKIGVFFLAVLPGFATGSAPIWQQILVLGAIFTLTSALVLSLIALAGGAARAYLDQSVYARRILTGLSALAFAGLGLRLLLSRPS